MQRWDGRLFTCVVDFPFIILSFFLSTNIIFCYWYTVGQSGNERTRRFLHPLHKHFYWPVWKLPRRIEEHMLKRLFWQEAAYIPMQYLLLTARELATNHWQFEHSRYILPFHMWVRRLLCTLHPTGKLLYRIWLHFLIRQYTINTVGYLLALVLVFPTLHPA